MGRITLSAIALVAFLALLPAQDTRPRLVDEKPTGLREKLSLGTLFVPASLPAGKTPLFLHFHGPGWIAEAAAARNNLAVIHAQLGSGSAVYGKPFADPTRLKELLTEAKQKAGREFELVGLSGWSAGYGAVRAILRVEEYYQQVQWVVLMDGLHAGYTDVKKSKDADLDCYLRLAKDAAAGKKRFLVTHSAIVPGNYASTTETANALLAHVGAKRSKAVTDVGLPVETETQVGGLTILGCKGTTAPDHVDHLHVLPRLLDAATRGYADAVVIDDVPLVHTTQLVPDPKKDGGTAERQINRLLDQLAEAGLDKVVRLNVYAASDDIVPTVHAALAKRYLGRHLPALTLMVGTPVADGVLVSLDAVATAGKATKGSILPAGPAYYIAGQAERGKSLVEATQRTLSSLDKTLTFLDRGQGDVVQVKAFLHPMKEIANVRKTILAHFASRPAPPITLVEWTFKDSIEIEMVVAGKPSKEKATDAVEYLTPPGMTASPVYSRVARINHGKRIYTSGLTGTGKDGAAEVKGVFAQLGAILKKHNSDMKHLAKATYYVANDDVSKQLNLLRPGYYDPKRPPAASKAPVRGTGRKGSGLVLDMIAVVP